MVFWRSAEVVIYVLAIALIYVVCKPPRLLNNPITQYLGLISYSLYLCHEYTSNVVWPRLFGQAHRLPPLLGITLEILLAIAGATLLHYAIERPFLRLKDRFHPRRARLSAPV